MLTDIYVREKLAEMGGNTSRSQRVPARSVDIPFAAPAGRLIGRLLCRIGERLQGARTFPSDTQFSPPIDAVVNSGSAAGTTPTVPSASGVFLPGQ
jgi:hypothetical protein